VLEELYRMTEKLYCILDEIDAQPLPSNGAAPAPSIAKLAKPEPAKPAKQKAKKRQPAEHLPLAG
jgi:hypothetical protein